MICCFFTKKENTNNLKIVCPRFSPNFTLSKLKHAKTGLHVWKGWDKAGDMGKEDRN